MRSERPHRCVPGFGRSEERSQFSITPYPIAKKPNGQDSRVTRSQQVRDMMPLLLIIVGTFHATTDCHRHVLC